ncbi:hypothetical protein POM88_047784 [Heracleum sosnowskyi]|uniref:PB1-like domain-containing protein n=1 Tax=Heracleum sosnowskyi TaxID=360622 RepID=A0AAD8LZY1_9APIA|nr:hypothetical protein POM88_047784 [Heracleum sosnowskyi]
MYVAASSKYFTIKVHHGGDFDDDLNGYHGGEISYFDMCAQWHFNMYDMESMMTELGLELGQFCLWFCIPDTEIVQGLIPLVKSEDVETLSDFVCYSSCLNLYTTDSMIDFGSDFNYFSFTQFEEDERIERIEQIREERGYEDEGEELPKEDEGVEDDKLSFEGDSSNMDSNDSEVDILPKKKKRIPPPNPPYRTRKRGRYSMLRGLFKNTEDTPIVLDDTGPNASQPSQEEVDGKGKCRLLKDDLRMEGVQPDERTSKVRTCTKCKQVGHNKRTCKNESVDTNNGKKPTRDKKNGKKPNVKPPVQQPNVKSIPVKHILRSSSATATHEGIIRPFKPPTQKKGTKLHGC